MCVCEYVPQVLKSHSADKLINCLIIKGRLNTNSNEGCMDCYLCVCVCVCVCLC